VPERAHVFISYRSCDQQVAYQFCSVLERDGLTCWIAPRDIGPGASWPESIIKAIGDSWLMVCVVSREAYRSRHMAREIERADSNDVAILPVRIDSTPLDGELQFFLGNRQSLDLSDGSSSDHGQQLVQAVRGLERQSAKPPSPADASPGRAAAIPNSAPIGLPRAEGRVIDAIRDEAARVVQMFVNVLTKREKAFDGLVLSDARILSFALRFLVYMALVSLVLHLPAWAAQKISLNSPGPVLSFLTDDLMEKLMLCIILHVAMRSVGGTADLRESVCVFCFLCAFAPLIAVSLIPSQTLTGSLLRNSSSAGDFLERLSPARMGTAAGDLPVFAICFALSTVLWLIFFTALFKANRTLHRLGRVRAAAAFVTGAAAWMIIQFVLLYSFESATYKGFGAG
jgi:hypothetical protein